MTGTRNAPLPLAYRAEVLTRIMPSLQAGECCALVGTSGVGKSNLMRFLQRHDVQMAYWGNDHPVVVLIDAHSLVFGELPNEYVVAELMIHRLIMEAEQRALPVELITWADELHRKLVAQPSTHLALRYLERFCSRLCMQHGLQIVFCFDQFENLWQSLAAQFFLNLRNLRDQCKYYLVYLILMRKPLHQLRSDLQAVEAFWELFSSDIYGLGMYSVSDAQSMLERLAQRRGVTIDDARCQTILMLSGQHPGLLRALFGIACSDVNLDLTPDTLVSLRLIVEECTKIWYDLTIDEQQLLQQIALGQSVPSGADSMLEELALKEIIIGQPPQLFSPLFTAYLLRQSGHGAPGVMVDLRQRQVWIEGQLLERSLAPLEFGLLAYLARHAGAVCEREAILRELYPEDCLEVNDQRLDTLMRRLRDALGDDARNPRHLITHRGVGIQLVQGGIQAE